MLKRIFDILFSCAALLVFSPFWLLIYLAIKVGSSGPVLFEQQRLGLRGRIFMMYKFRTMIDGAEDMDEGLFNYQDDVRVTSVGAFLRATSLDEVPQLLNILRGEMSFVGPRPPVSYELGAFQEIDAHTKRRFLVKPGVTGLAQVNGRNELSRDEKTFYDLKYVEGIEKWGLVYDIHILLKTLVVIFSNKGKYELRKNAQEDERRIDRSLKPKFRE